MKMLFHLFFGVRDPASVPLHNSAKLEATNKRLEACSTDLKRFLLPFLGGPGSRGFAVVIQLYHPAYYLRRTGVVSFKDV